MGLDIQYRFRDKNAKRISNTSETLVVVHPKKDMKADFSDIFFIRKIFFLNRMKDLRLWMF